MCVILVVGMMRYNFVDFIFKFGPVVQEDISFKDISYQSIALVALLFSRAKPLVPFW